MKYPFTQTTINDTMFIREFKQNTSDEELVWHRDRENRTIKVLEGKNWKLQLDNELPVVLELEKTYFIPAFLYHRVIKGSDKLVIEISINELPTI